MEIFLKLILYIPITTVIFWFPFLWVGKKPGHHWHQFITKIITRKQHFTYALQPWLLLLFVKMKVLNSSHVLSIFDCLIHWHSLLFYFPLWCCLQFWKGACLYVCSVAWYNYQSSCVTVSIHSNDHSPMKFHNIVHSSTLSSMRWILAFLETASLSASFPAAPTGLLLK